MMSKTLSKSSAQRDRWAISLSFAAAILLSLEALHPGACVWMGMGDEQSFALSATFATVSMFLGTFILSRQISK